MKRGAVFFLLWTVLTAVYYWGIASRVELIAYREGRLEISDFAYYSVIVRGFWFQGHRGFYDLSDNIEVLKSLTEPQFRWVMPLAVTPTATLIFLPFSWVSLKSVALAQSLWVGFSLSTLSFALARFWERRRNLSPRTKLRGLALVLMGFLSLVFWIAFVQGQTSILFLAALLFFASRDTDRPFDWASFFCSWYIGMKPFYLLIGLFLLAAERRWILVLSSLLWFGFSCFIFSLFAGFSWLPQYFELFGLFRTYPLPEVVASAFHFDAMNILRTAFRDYLPQEVSVRWSNRFFLSGLSLSAFLALIDLVFGGKREDRRGKYLPLMFFLMSYFLFSPYIGVYEEILLFFPVFLGLMYFQPRRVGVFHVIAVFALLICLNFSILNSNGGCLLRWLMKGVLFFVLLVQSLGARSVKESQA